MFRGGLRGGGPQNRDISAKKASNMLRNLPKAFVNGSCRKLHGASFPHCLEA